jgi:hypothetical protein
LATADCKRLVTLVPAARPRLDKASRYLIKRDPAGFFRWLLRRNDIVFRAWIDARRLALPDQRDLANDLVAALAVGDAHEALCVEIQAESEVGAASRLLLGYVPRLLTEPDVPNALPLTTAGGAVINLTGRSQPTGIEHRLSVAPGCWLAGGILQRALREEDASAMIAEVAGGTASPWLGAWLPLMHGGAEASTIEGWQHTVRATLDAASRRPSCRASPIPAASNGSVIASWMQRPGQTCWQPRERTTSSGGGQDREAWEHGPESGHAAPVYAVSPLSITRFVPVTYSDSSEAR